MTTRWQWRTKTNERLTSTTACAILTHMKGNKDMSDSENTYSLTVTEATKIAQERACFDPEAKFLARSDDGKTIIERLQKLIGKGDKRADETWKRIAPELMSFGRSYCP